MRNLPVVLLLASLLSAFGSPAVSDQNDPRLDPLFTRLAAAETGLEAARAEEQIWSAWLQSNDEAIDAAMGRGIAAMGTGNHAAARLAFDSIVSSAPNFAEGWNKRATLFFMMGRLDASLRDIDRTLELEPRHFGALSGLAMIREIQGRPFDALEALEQVSHLHPRLPHLQERVDRLSKELGDPI